MNRVEYANAIRDLFALDVDTSSMLPPDDAAYGFDNIADALGMSPVLLERYLTAADKITSLAVGDPETQTAGQTFRIRQDASQDTHIEGLPIGTIGGILAKTTLPLDGEYKFGIRLVPHQSRRRARPGIRPSARVHGRRRARASLEGRRRRRFQGQPQEHDEGGRRRRGAGAFRMPLKAGPHTITVAFLERTDAVNPLRLQPFIRSSNDTLDTIGHPHLDTFTLTGPFNPTGPGDTPSRRRIFFCRPASTADEEACARRIITTFARRAYRGHDGHSDLERLTSSTSTGRKEGTFERGIQMALERMIASPKFIFRVERDPAGRGCRARSIGSPISSSPRGCRSSCGAAFPTISCCSVARQGTLHTPAVLNQQVRRMLADPKSQALVDNFAGQWLYLRNLKNLQPNSTSSRTSTTTCAGACNRDRALLPKHHARGPQRRST